MAITSSCVVTAKPAYMGGPHLKSTAYSTTPSLTLHPTMRSGLSYRRENGRTHAPLKNSLFACGLTAARVSSMAESMAVTGTVASLLQAGGDCGLP